MNDDIEGVIDLIDGPKTRRLTSFVDGSNVVKFEDGEYRLFISGTGQGNGPYVALIKPQSAEQIIAEALHFYYKYKD